jgi:uncharacterized protein YuzE
MKLHFDEKSDALYFRLYDSKIIESEEVQPGLILDFNEYNQVVGIEILGVKNRVSIANLTQVELEIS